MVKCSHPSDEQPVPLCVTDGHRLVMPDGESVLGWIGSQSGGTAEPLIFPARLLEPETPSTIFYEANLPRFSGKAEASRARVKTVRKIPLAQEGSFLAASLPGGQVNTLLPGGCKGILRFRWLPLGPLSWRCFVSQRGISHHDAWTPLPHVYSFNSLGHLESHPGPQLFNTGGHELLIVHREGLLTCLPCTSGLVKIRNLETDGWEKRELTGLELLPNRMIEARFSDRRSVVFATAAPAQVPHALAA